MKPFLKLRLAIALSLATIATGCKTRQVQLHTSSIADHSVTTESKTVDSTHIYTGKQFSHFKDSVSSRDAYEVLISTDTGIVVVNAGKFTGRAKSITVKGWLARDSVGEASMIIEHGEITNTTFKDTSTKKADILIMTKDKEVESKPDYNWIIWGIIAVGLVVLSVILYMKFKP